jgi:hypothetical protein
VRHSLSLLACAALAACSSTPQVYGPSYDGGGDAADATADAPADVGTPETGTDAGSDAPSCASIVAVVGGSSTSLFGAGGPASSALTADSLPGTLADCGTSYGCADPVAIVRLGSGLLAALADSSGALQSTTFQASWADPAPVASASTIDGPSLATIGSVAHLLFQDASYKYVHAEYTASAWDSANDPVGGSGSSQSYGARAPGGAAAGTDLVAVQAGADSYLYDQTWNGSWQTAHKQGGAAVQNTIPPVVVALSGGGAELLAAYLRLSDYKVMAVARTSGTWGTPMLVDANAFSNDPVALGALPGGKALLVFRGTDNKPYFSTWDGATTWTAPAPVLTTNNPSVGSTPSIAPGVCGADAMVAWAESGGGVRVASFAGGAFGAPASVAGTSGAKFVAIGTLP